MSSYENETPSDNSYVSRPGHKNEPLGVVSDETRIEDPIDANTADSDQQLGMFCIRYFHALPTAIPIWLGV